MNKKSGKHIANVACPRCRERGRDNEGDNLGVYEQDDGHQDATCWSCELYIPNYEGEACEHNEPTITQPLRTDMTLDLSFIQSQPSKAIQDRGLNVDTVSRYGVKQIDDKRFYPVAKEGKTVGYRCRKLPKEFSPKKGATPVGDISATEFFGQHLFGKGNGMLIITEGEEDAMSVYQATAAQSPKHVGYAAVSVPSGTGSLERTVLENYEWLEGFEKIVFAMDQEPKVLAKVREVCKLLPPNKSYIAKFEEKDASDMLKTGKGYQLYKALWNAEVYKPEGLILGSETWDAWQNRNNYDAVPLPEMWGLNSKLKGLRTGGLYTVGAGTGVGKTLMLKLLQLHLWEVTPHNIGIIALEEMLCDSVGMLMGLHTKKPLYGEGGTMSDPEAKEAWNTLFADNRFVFEQGFGALNEEDLYNKIRYMVRVQGCKYIFLDHLTAITDMYGSGTGNKIEQTARLVAEIKNLTQELECVIIQVSHVRKRGDDQKSYEQGAVPGLDSLYGAAAIKQYSDAVISIARDQREDPSITTYHVVKNRHGGRLGPGAELQFNHKTGWLEPSEGVM